MYSVLNKKVISIFERHNMKKIILFCFSLLFYFSMNAQLEKRMLLLDTNVFSNNLLSTNTRTNEETTFLSVRTKTGLFLNTNHLLGTRLSLRYSSNKRRSQFTNQQERNINSVSEINPFYRFYPFSKKRVGIFGEVQLGLIGNSRNPNFYFNQFKAQLGAGAYVFITKNIAFEANFLTPIFYSRGLNDPAKFLGEFGIISNFKRPKPTRLPKLEDTYLFVRNLYYGFGFQQSSNGNIRDTPRRQLALNAGFFIGMHWLFDLSYSFEDFNFGSGISSNSFGDLRLESAFFIRLNEKGTYLRPAVSFKLETGRQIGNANPSLIGFQKSIYVNDIEVAQFIGDQLILGGGASMVLTRFDVKADHFQFNANLRMTYFLTKDFAIEYKGAFYINDKFVNNTDEQLLLTLSHINAELKIRHFLFQK